MKISYLKRSGVDRQFGVMQPLLVTNLDSGSYRIIVGERRFRAARWQL